MNKTKIYLIVKITMAGFLSPRNRVVGFAMDKLSAEYMAWKLDQEQLDAPKQGFYCGNEIGSYIVEEVTFLETEKGKDFKKFVAEKKNDIQQKIQSLRECKEEDEVKIRDLNDELASLETQ